MSVGISERKHVLARGTREHGRSYSTSTASQHAPCAHIRHASYDTKSGPFSARATRTPRLPSPWPPKAMPQPRPPSLAAPPPSSGCHRRSRAAVDPSSTGYGVDAQRTRDAHSGAPSHSGGCGCWGGVGAVERKLPATQTVREQRARDDQNVREHASRCWRQAGRAAGTGQGSAGRGAQAVRGGSCSQGRGCYTPS